MAMRVLAPILTQSVIEALPRLEQANAIVRSGSYIEVRSPFLANRFAKQLLGPNRRKRDLLFNELDLNGKLSLIDRLKSIGTSKKNWQFLFRKRPKGPLCDLESAVQNSQILSRVAHAQPVMTSNIIHQGLSGKSVEDRKKITGVARMGLVSALNALLFHDRTRQEAILDLGSLAEAEVDNYANNATGTFVSFFYPIQPQASWSFTERIQTLKEIIFNDSYSIQLRSLAINAIESSLHPLASRWMAESSGTAVPLDPPFRGYTTDTLDYVEDLVIVLEAAMKSAAQPLRHRASVILPTANAESSFLALKLPNPASRLERIARRFEALTRCDTDRETVPILELDSALLRFRDLLTQNIEKRSNATTAELKEAPDFAAASDDELSSTVAQIRQSVPALEHCVQVIGSLRERLREQGFHARIKLWAGSDWEPEEKVHMFGLQPPEWLVRTPRALVQEVLADPSLLDAETMRWLCLDESKRAGVFFNELGKQDQEGHFVGKIKKIGAFDTGQSVENFGRYIQGVNYARQGYGSQLVNKLIKDESIKNTDAILCAIAYLGYSKTHFEQLKSFLKTVNAAPSSVANVASSWINELRESEYCELMTLVAGPSLENAAIILAHLYEWLQKRGIESVDLEQLAWLCLESAPLVAENQTYVCDSLASALGRKDLNRGMSLLRRALESQIELTVQQDFLRPWNLFSLLGPHQFWDVLWEASAAAALDCVVQVALNNPGSHYRIASGVRHVLNQSEAADILINIASKSRDHAQIVCSCISADKRAFWKICCGIIECYPHDIQLQDAMISSATFYEAGYVGELRTNLEKRLTEMEELNNNPQTSAPVKVWIKKLEPILKNELESLVDYS